MPAWRCECLGINQLIGRRFGAICAKKLFAVLLDDLKVPADVVAFSLETSARLVRQAAGDSRGYCGRIKGALIFPSNLATRFYRADG